jgi:hypothetical protein
MQPESLWEVIITENALEYKDVVGQVVVLPWDNLESVVIQTDDSGPFSSDVWWILSGRTANGTPFACQVPLGATGEKEMIDRLQQLPGFDNEALILAMGSVEDAQFVCWKKESATP